MAVSATPVLSPFRIGTGSHTSVPSSSPTLFLFNGSSKPRNPPPSTVVFSSKNRTELSEKEQKQLQFLKQNGLDFGELLSDANPKFKGKWKQQRKEKGNELTTKEQLQFLKQNGLDSGELLSNANPKFKGKRKLQRKEKGNELTAKEPRKPQRATHELIKVIAGKAHRRKLLSPQGLDVRPMMNVVKGATFSILQAAGGCQSILRPGRWLDLYSGTGCVGIEAMSRGCTEAHFVEMDPWLVSNVIRPNLERTGFQDVSVIHTLRVEIFLERAGQLVDKSGPFDYISVTPPYTEVDYEVLMGQISRSGLIGENTFIVVEYPKRTEMLESCGCLELMTTRKFGRTFLAIYGPKWAQKKR